MTRLSGRLLCKKDDVQCSVNISSKLSELTACHRDIHAVT
jgi:hypothetical protein